jgi:hypothetical protein
MLRVYSKYLLYLFLRAPFGWSGYFFAKKEILKDELFFDSGIIFSKFDLKIIYNGINNHTSRKC